MDRKEESDYQKEAIPDDDEEEEERVGPLARQGGASLDGHPSTFARLSEPLDPNSGLQKKRGGGGEFEHLSFRPDDEHYRGHLLRDEPFTTPARRRLPSCTVSAAQGSTPGEFPRV